MRAWRGYLLMVLGFVVIPGLVAWRTTDAEAQKIFTWAIYNFIVFPLVILAFGALIVLYGIISSWPRTVRRKAAVSPTANEPGQFGPAEVPIAYRGTRQNGITPRANKEMVSTARIIAAGSSSEALERSSCATRSAVVR